MWDREKIDKWVVRITSVLLAIIAVFVIACWTAALMGYRGN